MTTEAEIVEIVEILVGQKMFDGGTWRVFDEGGAEIADAGGVLWRGVHGALLWNINAERSSIYPEWRRRGRRQ
jgi:hypothetical protein